MAQAVIRTWHRTACCGIYQARPPSVRRRPRGATGIFGVSPDVVPLERAPDAVGVVRGGRVGHRADVPAPAARELERGGGLAERVDDHVTGRDEGPGPGR